MNNELIDWKNFNINPLGYDCVSNEDKQQMKKDLFRNRNVFVFHVWKDESREECKDFVEEVFLLDNPIYISILYELEEKYPDEMPDTYKVKFIPGRCISEAVTKLAWEQHALQDELINNRLEIKETDFDLLEVNEENLDDDFDRWVDKEALELSPENMRRCPACGYEF